MMKVIAYSTCISLLFMAAGCPGTGGGGGGNTNANSNANANANSNDNGGGGVEATFTATLTGATEVPLVETDGQGEGEFTLSADQTEIEFRVTASGLSGPVTVAHFHQGGVDVAGPIVIDLSGDVVDLDGEVTIEGSAAVEADFVEALLSGDIYVNIHTALNAAGEIRGQLEEGGGNGRGPG